MFQLVLLNDSKLALYCTQTLKRTSIWGNLSYNSLDISIKWLQRNKDWQHESGDPTPIIISSPFSDYDDLTQKHPELLI